MSNVLFLCTVALENPRRGTPIHIVDLLHEMRKNHALWVCTASVPAEFNDIFIRYPKERGWSKFRTLIHMVREKKAEHVFTVAQTGLLAPVLLKLFCKVKIEVELHGMDYEEFYASGRIGWLRYLFMRWKVWTLLHFYDTVFVESRRHAERFAPMSKDWVIAQGGVHIEKVPDVSGQMRENDELVVGYMGNTRSYQGLSNLIEGVALARKDGVPARLNLILSGEDDEVRKELEARGLTPFAKITRNVTHDEAYRLIAQSDVLVIPRPNSPITEYTFPSKLAECLATGIPTIATRIGPIDEMKEEFGRYALLIEPENIPTNIATALKKVAAMSPEERRALGAKARPFAERFSWHERWKKMSPSFA